MTHSLRFLWAAPVLLVVGLQPAYGQCSRSVRSHCSQQNKTQSVITPVPTPAPAMQRAALLRLGTGLSLSGAGDFPAVKTHLEYAPQLSKSWRLASRLAYIGGSEMKYYGEGFNVPRSYRAVNAEQEIHWLPFGAGRAVELGVGGGIYAGYARQIGVSAVTYNTDASGNESFSYVARQKQGLDVGYIASLYADFALDRRAEWRLGGRLALQDGTRATIMPGGQLQVSRAF